MKTYSNEDLFNSSVKVSIGHDVWIGERAIIIDGLTIGTGAIIAAGAVVVKDVEPYSIVGGVPAKHIRFRFEEEVRTKLLNSKWWDKSEEYLSEHYADFLDVNSFLDKY